MIRHLVAIAILALAGAAVADTQTITLASTTSTQNSGLYDAILPVFLDDTGITVQVVAVGTGQALRIAKSGDADVLVVHHRPSEDAFVAGGFGIERRDVMYNDFVIVGPIDDPARVADQHNVAGALAAIEDHGAVFLSRGDDSGTHRRERELWALTGVETAGDWYRETGSGMGATLNIAQEMGAYVLTDRGTWITFGNKSNLRLVFSGDRQMFNPYGVILVNPAIHPHINAAAARAFSDWLISDRGQSAIGDFQIMGHQAFCPNANDEASRPVAAEHACPSTTAAGL